MSNTIELNCFLHPIVEMNVNFIFVEIFEELTCYYFFENYIFICTVCNKTDSVFKKKVIVIECN